MSRDAVATYLEAEVCCYHCGYGSGVLRCARSTPGAPMLYSEHAGGTRIVRRVTELRCSHCKGPVYADTFEVRHVYARLVSEIDRPRRGRPPKRPVEQQPAARRSA
jgi:hypothetical protein